MNSRLAECVGLWLAEGDNKSNSEITFTNNCWKLVKLFYEKVICKYDGNPRVYVYSPSKRNVIKLGRCRIKYYTDKRASKPYYVLRLASAHALKNWRQKVRGVLKIRHFYSRVLRGFFAGEGNIKSGQHGNRCLRIAQKEPKEFVDRMLQSLGMSFKFNLSGRAYELTGKWNWDKFAQYHIADLHPDKKTRFLKVYKGFKEEHYPNFHLKNVVLRELNKPKTTKQLAKTLNRTPARLCDVLMELKKENKIKNFRVRSETYWSNQKIVVISKVKLTYLKLLSKGMTKTSEFAKTLNVDWKSAWRRLKELEKLGLAKLYDHDWRRINVEAKVVVL